MGRQLFDCRGIDGLKKEVLEVPVMERTDYRRT